MRRDGNCDFERLVDMWGTTRRIGGEGKAGGGVDGRGGERRSQIAGPPGVGGGGKGGGEGGGKAEGGRRGEFAPRSFVGVKTLRIRGVGARGKVGGNGGGEAGGGRNGKWAFRPLVGARESGVRDVEARGKACGKGGSMEQVWGECDSGIESMLGACLH